MYKRYIQLNKAANFENRKTGPIIKIAFRDVHGFLIQCDVSPEEAEGYISNSVNFSFWNKKWRHKYNVYKYKKAY